MTHICVSKLPTIGSDNGLSSSRRQGIIWTNAGILLFEPLWTNYSKILIEIQTFSFKKMHLKTLSVKRQSFSLGLNVLRKNNHFMLFMIHYILSCTNLVVMQHSPGKESNIYFYIRSSARGVWTLTAFVKMANRVLQNYLPFSKDYCSWKTTCLEKPPDLTLLNTVFTAYP